jgi:predicted NBD/HSP70 family sugar kinase
MAKMTRSSPITAMKILVVDVGGSHIKALLTGKRKPVKIPSGPRLTPRAMVRDIRTATSGWRYDRVTIGYPGPVIRGRIVRDPWNLARGWKGFDFRRAFGRPVRIINDAAMQALGSYQGGRMLFLGLGTGLGCAMVLDGTIVPLEVSHLPYKSGLSYEDYLGEAGMKRFGKHAWRKHVATVTALYMDAFAVDYIVLGGGNVRHLKTMPKHTRQGNNANAFRGGFRLWADRRRA